MEQDTRGKKEKIISVGTDLAASAASTGAGLLIGGAVAGPGGAVAGAMVGTLIEKAVTHVGQEIQNRVLSKAEARKAGMVYTKAIECINANLEKGRELRKDDFFRENVDNRSAAEEILEGTIFAAQKEADEKKIRFLARIYGNIVFTEEISKSTANYMLKLAEQMTYRQIMILYTIGVGQISKNVMNFTLFKKDAYHGVAGVKNVEIATEIFDLYRKSIVMSSSVIFDSASITPAALSIEGYGAHLFHMMDLQNVAPLDADDLAMITDISEFLVGTKKSDM